jgi:hypothetical protein
VLTEYPNIVQGTPEWHDIRRGLVTASSVGKLLTTDPPDSTSIPCPACGVEAGPCLSLSRPKKPTLLKTSHTARTALAAERPAVLKVADNDTSRALTATLVAERITGWTEDGPMTSDMWRGREMEPFARDHYSGHYQQAVEIGFMQREEDGWTLGLSPDGLVGFDGGVEIKCPRAKTHIAWTIADVVPSQHMAQVQSALLVSGRDWWDFGSYVGGLPLFVKRVYPDPAWFAAITAACIQFEKNAEALVAKYRAATAGLPATERIELHLEVI